MGKVIIHKIILSIVLFYSSQLLSQNTLVSYDIIYKPLMHENQTETERYNLLIDNNTKSSFFYSDKIVDNSFNANVFKDFSKDEYYKYEIILFRLYKVPYQIDLKWDLLEGDKLILGFPCKKSSVSFGGRRWVAWYTQEMAIQNGPYKFQGLPGLILEISSEDGDYEFIAKSIVKTKEDVPQYTNVTWFKNEDKMRKFKEMVVSDPVAQYKQDLANNNSGIKVSASYDGKQSTNNEFENFVKKEFYKFLKLHNNPIEFGDLWIK